MHTVFKILMCFLFIASACSAQWNAMNNTFGKEIRCMIKNGTSLLVGTNDNGVYRSNNSDTNWEQTNAGLSNTKVYSLASNGSTVVAGTYGGGTFLSTDNGSSWTQKISGMALPYIYTVAVSANNIIAGSGGAGVYLSTNAGTNWNINLPSTYIANTLLVTDSTVLLGIGPYIYRSRNNGTDWFPVVTSNSTMKAFALIPKGGGGAYWFVGSLDGVFLTTDNGVNWTTVNSGLAYKNINGLAVSGQKIFAATENGGVYYSSNFGASWTALNDGLPSNTSARTIVADENSIYVGTAAGVVWSRSVSGIPTSVGEKQRSVVNGFTLEQNFPNPFNPVTSITFSMNTPGMVSLTVYNILGEQIAVLVNDNLTSGFHSVRFDASSFASGIYFYTVRTQNVIETKRMVLLK